MIIELLVGLLNCCVVIELTKKPFSHAPLFTPSPPPQILQNHRFQFLLGNTVVIREVEDNGHIIFGGRGRGEREGVGGKEGALWYM